mmetsp:Transcript_78804/g.255308  ORF Transcript_78804/g.255308 Transcript_78804/m.255308 type:complete len:357 (-) Transcript_78804:107-1177(-)
MCAAGLGRLHLDGDVGRIAKLERALRKRKQVLWVAGKATVVRLRIGLLSVVHSHGRCLAGPAVVARERRGPRRALRELHDAPALGEVHVDLALRAPDPVVLVGSPRVRAGLAAGLLAVAVSFGVGHKGPLHAAEAQAPEGAVVRGFCAVVVHEVGQRQRNLHSPVPAFLVRVVQGPLRHHPHGRPRPRQHGPASLLVHPGGVLAAPVRVRLVQAEAPPGVEGVHLILLVEVGAAVRVDEDLEVVVVVDHGVVLLECGPGLGIVELRGHVEVLVVPTNLCPRAPHRADARGDVDEVLRPVNLRPDGLLQVPVQDFRAQPRRLVGDVLPRVEVCIGAVVNVASQRGTGRGIPLVQLHC